MKSMIILISLITLVGCTTITRPNVAVLNLSSEPSGAKIYEEGKYWGTTPLSLEYTLRDSHYDQGSINLRDFDLIYPGAYPEKYEPTLKIDPADRPDPANWRTGGKRLQYYKLVIFKAPSSTTPVSAPTGNQNINVHHQKDDLDTINSGLDALLKLNALPRIR